MPCSGCSALHGMNPNLKKESERFVLFNDNVCNNNFCWQEFSSLVYFKSGPFYRISYVGGVDKSNLSCAPLFSSLCWESKSFWKSYGSVELRRHCHSCEALDGFPESLSKDNKKLWEFRVNHHSKSSLQLLSKFQRNFVLSNWECYQCYHFWLINFEDNAHIFLFIFIERDIKHRKHLCRSF